MALPYNTFKSSSRVVLILSSPSISKGRSPSTTTVRGRISAFRYEEVLGKNVLEIYPSIDEARQVMAAMRADDGEGKGRVSNFETIFKTKKGEKIPVAISASIIYDDEGNEIGSIGFAKDIREIQAPRSTRDARRICHRVVPRDQ